MTHIKRLSSLLLAVLMMFIIIPASVQAASDGWNMEGEHWYYYKDGSKLKSQWLKVGGKWYYLTSVGEMLSDTMFLDNDGSFYYFDKSGALITKEMWISRQSYWIYATKGGKLAVGWHKIGGKWYYFHPDGPFMVSRAIFPYGLGIDGEVYFFGDDGALLTKTWYRDANGNWVYLDNNGRMLTGWQKIDKKWYYFSPHDGVDYLRGEMFQFWWLEDPYGSGKFYFFGNDGAMVTSKWVTVKDGSTDRWFYLNSDGTAAMKWKRIGGKWYYFDPARDGLCVTNTTKRIDGKDYKFDKNGACLNP